jgi:hypothetical protein
MTGTGRLNPELAANSQIVTFKYGRKNGDAGKRLFHGKQRRDELLMSPLIKRKA